MFLYLLTLQKATAITQAAHGNFSGTKQQEIAVGRGKTIDLYRIDPTTGKLHSMLSVDFFGLVRSLTPFRLTGSNKGKRTVLILITLKLMRTYYFRIGSFILLFPPTSFPNIF